VDAIADLATALDRKVDQLESVPARSGGLEGRMNVPNNSWREATERRV
jgi:hypothetical protein